MLIAARVLLGIGAAFLVPLTMAVIPVMFEESERTMAVGIWGAANFLAFPIGPILGGWILTKFRWGAVFLINVPVVVLAIIAVAALLPESRSEKRPGLDPLGVLLSSFGLVGLTYGVIHAGQNGWGEAQTLIPLFAGALFVVCFVLWERSLTRRPGGKPLIDLALFRSPRFTWGTILAMFSIFAMSGLLFTLPQYSEAVLGTDSMGAGLRLLPMIGGLVLGAVSSNRFTTRAGAKVTAALGFGLVTAGMLAGHADKHRNRLRIHGRVDRRGGRWHGIRAFGGGRWRLGRAAGREERRRLIHHAGGSEDRVAIRNGNPGGGLQQRVSRAPRPDGGTGAAGERCPKERLRRDIGRNHAQIGSTSPDRALCIRVWDERHAVGVRRDGRAVRHSHPDIPARALRPDRRCCDHGTTCRIGA